MKTALGSAITLFFACAMVFAQSTAQIHGTVQDASGAAIPGAEVKATQTDTGVSRTANSGADGGYVLTIYPWGRTVWKSPKTDSPRPWKRGSCCR